MFKYFVVFLAFKFKIYTFPKYKSYIFINPQLMCIHDFFFLNQNLKQYHDQSSVSSLYHSLSQILHYQEKKKKKKVPTTSLDMRLRIPTFHATF